MYPITQTDDLCPRGSGVKKKSLFWRKYAIYNGLHKRNSCAGCSTSGRMITQLCRRQWCAVGPACLPAITQPIFSRLLAPQPIYCTNVFDIEFVVIYHIDHGCKPGLVQHAYVPVNVCLMISMIIIYRTDQRFTTRTVGILGGWSCKCTTSESGNISIKVRRIL